MRTRIAALALAAAALAVAAPAFSDNGYPGNDGGQNAGGQSWQGKNDGGSGWLGGDTAAKPVGAIIVANPIDLDTITSISLFRSCAGHDYSGIDAQGKRETDRSMKHYVNSSIAAGDADALHGYAPFAGTVTTQPETDPIGQQVWVTSKSGWALVFFHGDPLVKPGTKVKAGQPVVAWPAKNIFDYFKAAGRYPPTITTVDVAFRNGATVDSFLLHMAPKVAAMWAAKGFTPANSIVSQQARDAAPCNGVYDWNNQSNFVSATG
ncbi:MAG: hypothetical protein JO073_06685 [Actinobacteria bacterium]|nr:hypothetical protein [Actinomycetota bacterium]